MVSSNRTLRVQIIGDADDALRALKQMDSELGNVETRSGRAGKVMDTAFRLGTAAIAAGTTAAIAGGVAAFKLASSYAEAGSQIHDLAQRTGFSTEALSEFKYAAEQSGTSIEGLEVGIRRMQSTVVDASNGVKAAKDSLDGIGVSVSSLRGLAPEQIFERMLNGLAGVEDETRRASLATDLFGRSGTQLLPIIADGTKSLKDMREEAHELGIVFSQEDADAADEFGDDMLRLNREIEGVRNAIARELLPALTPMVTQFAEWINQGGDEFAHRVAGGITAIANAFAPAIEGANEFFGVMQKLNEKSGGQFFGALSHPLGFSDAEKASGKQGWLNSLSGLPSNYGAQNPAAVWEPFGGAKLTTDPRFTGPSGGGFIPGGGGSASAKEDPLVAAWRRIHDQLEKEQQQALHSGGVAQLNITKQLQADLVAETQRMAERAHQAIGVDMSKAVTDSFDTLVDSGKAMRDSMEEVTRDIADLAKEMEREVKEKTAEALGMFQQLINAGFSGANALKFAQAATGGGLGGGGSFAGDVALSPGVVNADGSVTYTGTNYGTVNNVFPNVTNGGTPVPSTADGFAE